MKSVGLALGDSGTLFGSTRLDNLEKGWTSVALKQGSVRTHLRMHLMDKVRGIDQNASYACP